MKKVLNNLHQRLRPARVNADMRRRAFLTLALALSLVGAQAVLLVHHHDDEGHEREVELTHHVDCSICIKQGNESKVLPVDLALPTAIAVVSDTQTDTISGPAFPPLTLRSRGPPSSDS